MGGNGKGIKRKHVIYDSDLIGEIWREIIGFDGYEISNLGRVKSLPKHIKSPIILHHVIDKDGYIRVIIQKIKNRKYGEYIN